MFRIFYEFLLVLLAIISIPKIVKGYLKHGKYKESFPRRFGKGFPLIEKGNRKCIWIHAVSVGESKAIIPLAQMLKKEDPNCILVISTITETAQAEAKKSLPFADYHVYLPFDFGYVVRPIINQVKPDLVLLCETDFWYNFLDSSKQNGAKIVLVNGKVSERSQKRFQKYSYITNKIFNLIDLFCIQGEAYAQRFRELGVPESKIYVTGNIKLDFPIKSMESAELNAWKDKLGIKDEPLLVAGSTHDPEEKQILEALEEVWKSHPALKVMIVPRHPERFQEVATIISSANIPFQKYSALDPKNGAKVILMDAMGLLRSAYQCCTIAIVAGSYTEKVGGHNILEPCWYGKPVIHGPIMWSQPDLVELMRNYRAGLQVEMKDLARAISDLLSSEVEQKKLGAAGLKLVEESRGATLRTLEKINTEMKTLSCG